MTATEQIKVKIRSLSETIGELVQFHKEDLENMQKKLQDATLQLCFIERLSFSPKNGVQFEFLGESLVIRIGDEKARIGLEGMDDLRLFLDTMQLIKECG